MANSVSRIQGRKDDAGKPRPSLVPPFAELEVVNVLGDGAVRYGSENWHRVLQSPGGQRRYLDAALRHLSAYRRGNPHDADSGYHHLAHAVCCLLFILEGEMLQWSMPDAPEGE